MALWILSMTITFIIVMISKQDDRKVIWIARKALQRESLINSVSDSGKIVLNLTNKNGNYERLHQLQVENSMSS